MNIKRGLFRLWIVFSVPWVVVGGALIWKDLSNQSAGNPENPYYDIQREGEVADKCKSDPPTTACIRARLELLGHPAKMHSADKDLSIRILGIFGPPVALLVLGLTGFWVIRGFRNQEQTKSNDFTVNHNGDGP